MSLQMTAWRKIRLATGELVLAKDCLAANSTVTRPRKIAVLIRRDSVSLFKSPLRQICLPAPGVMLAHLDAAQIDVGILAVHVTAAEAREVVASYNLRRKELTIMYRITRLVSG